VFHDQYYDAVIRVKCSLSRSDGDSNRFLTSWWFIPHTNHTHPLNWATNHQWHYPGKCHGRNWGRNTQGPPVSQDAPWAYSSRPHHTPSASICAPVLIPARIMLLASRSKGTLFGQLNVRHAFNMTRGTSNGRSLIDTDEILIAPQNPIWLLPTFPSGLQLYINTWLFSGFQPFHS
jgi:hypothetical protein